MGKPIEQGDRQQLEELRQRLLEQARRVEDALQDTSSLPAQTFDLGDPMLEAALTDSAMQFFLQHMTGLGPQKMPLDDAAPSAGSGRREEIDVAELEQTMRDLHTIESPPCPPLMAGLDTERLWILIDLAAQGGSLGRHHASRELREVCQSIQDGQLDIDVLSALVLALQQTERDDILNQVLLRAVRFRLDKMADESGVDPAEAVEDGVADD